MEDFRFAEPTWSLVLWGVAFSFVLLLWLEQRGTRAIDLLLTPVLQERLVERPRRVQRVLRIALLALSAVCLVLALMRPQWGMRHVPAERSGAQIMIALDVSRSMLAEDVAPNRLDRAKAEIVDLLEYLDGDQVGLIAFGGRAAVLSPLTPDFDFLRLGLESVGPGSVGRGGTRLEEPLRKAIAGFSGAGRGQAGNASRALILITDGEDHGSFPLDAAKAAAEAGILVIAIGIGNEEGSPIRITDPRTGARELLRDADGEVVLSRLDGGLLRRIAEETGGAYVPAGTATLDLESIYREYIGPMTRGQVDPRGRTVRDELYPVAIFLGLFFLVTSVGVASAARKIHVVALAVFLVGTAVAPPTASAQSIPDHETQVGSEMEILDEEELAPREKFNRGVEALEDRDFEVAEERIKDAREVARGDSALQFRAAYDLGWLAVQGAGRIEGESPREALVRLGEAIDWFREASRLQPEDEDARVNLEVAQKRALVLEDRLARQGMGGVEESLAELSERQRGMAIEVAGLHTATAAALHAGDPNAPDKFRNEFRAKATGQREILADADELAHEAGRERDALEERSEADRQPEDPSRIAQLGNALHYLHRAREKMGQSRRQLRRRQGDSAYRRAAASLAELERALDQFRLPAELIDSILEKQTENFERTRELAARGLNRGPQDVISLQPQVELEAVTEDQVFLAGRAAELEARLRAGIDHSDFEGAAPSAEQSAGAQAVPRLAEAATHLSDAADDLEAENWSGAQLGQVEGIRALVAARELFLDLSGLIEATHRDEMRIAGALVSLQAGSDRDADLDALRSEYLPSLGTAQAKNIERADRLAQKIVSRGQTVSSGGETGPDGAPPDPEAVEVELQRLAQATEILQRARLGMVGVSRDLSRGTGNEAWDGATQKAFAVVNDLEWLRRVFFTIIERVRELARQELELSDATRDSAARFAGEASGAAEVGLSLAAAQAELAERTLAIATTLKEQSELAPSDESESEEVGRRLREAAEHVVLAEMEMTAAAQALELEVPNFSLSQPRQQQAGVELQAALELLEPPQQNPEEEKTDSEPKPDEEEGQQGESPSPEEAEPEEPVADPGQLLQAVRDQEADRRRQRVRAGGPDDAVEKNW